MEGQAVFSGAVVFLLLAISSASAANEAYVTVDSMGVEMCLAADGPANYVCDANQSLLLAGTRDHTLYFMPKTDLSGNETLIQTISYFALTPASLVVSLGFFLLAVFACVSLSYVLISAAGVKLW